MMSSMASITSSSSATVKVGKATSEFLVVPDWTLNIDICDTINSNATLIKDVVKVVKKRVQHKNPKVQLLALTLLETMVKNCGDDLHFQVADRNIVQEMVKIVKKKTDMQVRDKILTLIASWNEAFGGPEGRYPQFYMAYEDLRCFGVSFPKPLPDAAPIFTPPITRPVSTQPQLGYAMPSSSSTGLEAMSSDGSLSLSSIRSMRDVLDLLADMLRAVDPHDRLAVNDEVIVDLVEQSRANQMKLMQMLNTTELGNDERLLAEGLELNDKMRIVLAKHNAIASGFPLPLEIENFEKEDASFNHEISPKSSEASGASTSNVIPSAPDFQTHKGVIDEDGEEEDEFTLLAQRHSQTLNGSETPSSPVNKLVPVNSLAPVQAKDQDIIDLLSLSLSTTEQATPKSQLPPSAANHGNPFSDSSYPESPNHGLLGSSGYVAPWARTQQEFKSQPQPTYYPPPPWAPTPGYLSGQYSMPGQTYPDSSPRPMLLSDATQRLGHGLVNAGETQANNLSPRSTTHNTGQKPFIPSYKLYEDLDVFGKNDGRVKAGNNAASSSLSGSNHQSMVGEQK